MKKSDMMVALAASLGVGAATFYTMSKSDQPINTAVESVKPFLNNMTNGESSSNLGNTSNQYSGHNNSSHASNNSQNQLSNSNSSYQQEEAQTMGPFGMS